MRKTLFLAILLAISGASFAQKSVLATSDSLIDLRKYLSAYAVLDAVDSENNVPAILAKKSDICLNYFVKSMDHKLFALADLAPGVDLDSLREANTGTYKMFMFEADSLFNRLLKIHPDAHVLNLGLGNYYYEVLINYRGNWVESDSDLIEMAQLNLFDALRNGIRDRNTYSRLGYLALQDENYSVAAGYYRTAIDSGSIDVSDYYNIAVADLYLEKYPEGISYARYAYAHYTDSTWRSDAAHVLGSLFDESGSYDSALHYYDLSLAFQPLRESALRQIVALHLKFGKVDLASNAAERYFDLVEGQETLNDIVSAYHSANRDKELIAWFDWMEKKYAKDDENSGGLRLVEGQFYLAIGDKANARRVLNSARTYFQQVYDEDHEVFPFIEDLLNEAK